MASQEQAENKLREWARNNARRDKLIREARKAGVPINRIHTITGIARSTIYRLEQENTMHMPNLVNDDLSTLRDNHTGVEPTLRNVDGDRNRFRLRLDTGRVTVERTYRSDPEVPGGAHVLSSEVTVDGRPMSYQDPWARVADKVRNPDGYPVAVETAREALHEACGLFPRVLPTEDGWVVAASGVVTTVRATYRRVGAATVLVKAEVWETGGGKLSESSDLGEALAQLQ